jgi:hypothetical protein
VDIATTLNEQPLQGQSASSAVFIAINRAPAQLPKVDITQRIFKENSCPILFREKPQPSGNRWIRTIELIKPKKALEEAGGRTQVVSPTEKKIKGWDKKDWSEDWGVVERLNA